LISNMGCSSTKAAPLPVVLGSSEGKAGVAPPTVAECSVCTLKTSDGFYICAEANGAAKVDRQVAKEWEMITFEGKVDGKVALKSCHGKYLCADPNGVLTWDRDEATSYETFELKDIGEGKLTLRSHHGTYLCAQGPDLALVTREEATVSETFIRTAVDVTQTAADVAPDSKEESSVPSATEIPLASEEKPKEDQQPLSLTDIVALLSAAKNEDVVATLALLPESTLQKVLAALDANEATSGNMDTFSLAVVDDAVNTDDPVPKGLCGLC